MEYYNNILCVEAEWLYGEGEIMSENTYRHLVSRKQIKIVRRGCRNTPALAQYDCIPSRFRELMMNKLGGDPRKSIKRNVLAEMIAPDSAALEFYSSFTLSNGRHLPHNVQQEYYVNAIILNAIGRMAQDRKAFVKSRGGRINKLWEQLSDAIMEIDSSVYPHTLPNHPRRLEDRFKRFKAEGYQSLIHKNFCNKSAAKVNDDIKESMLTELIGDPRNLDNEQIRSLYNMVAEKMEWKKITAASVAVWRDKLDIITHPGRRGGNDFMNNKAMQVKRSKPTSPLFYWTMDGWDVELLYQAVVEDKKGNKVTTYFNRLTVVVVLDPSINYPIGYAVGSHETPELITAALRNAVNHTAELFGQRYRAHQLQSDNYSIKKLTPVYEAVAEKFTPARVKNAKAKVIEPYFHTLNKKYCQLMPNWSGFGVTSTKKLQPNVDFLNKMRHNFPDLEGCIAQIDHMIALERSEKIERYKELWSKTSDEFKLPLSWEQYLYWFGAETGFKNMLQGTGMTVSIEGIKRNYDCFDIRFREYASTRWAVKYDPDDTSRILAINDDGTLRFELEEKYTQPMALRDRQPGDALQLQRVKQYNGELVEKITEQRKHTATAIGELFQANPELNDTLTKLVLVDSKGQHKNERNALAGRDKETLQLEQGKVKPKKIATPLFDDWKRHR